MVNIRTKNAKYYDPVGIEKNDNFICKQFFALLKREIKLHENKEIENTKWQRMEYERVNEFEAYDHVDSAIYILRQALRIALCKNIQVRPEILPEYRNKLLFMLFKQASQASD